MNQQDETSKIELIAKDISYIQRDIATMNANIKELSGVYATKIALDDFSKTIDSRLGELEDSSSLWRWLSPTLSAILGSIVTFLIISYLGQFAHR